MIIFLVFGTIWCCIRNKGQSKVISGMEAKDLKNEVPESAQDIRSVSNFDNMSMGTEMKWLWDNIYISIASWTKIDLYRIFICFIFCPPDSSRRRKSCCCFVSLISFTMLHMSCLAFRSPGSQDLWGKLTHSRGTWCTIWECLSPSRSAFSTLFALQYGKSFPKMVRTVKSSI